MANTLMFEVGIKEADNQLTELEKRLKNIVNTYGKLELKVQVDGLKTFIAALENIGQGKGLEALQRRLDVLQVTLANAGMAGAKSMQEFEAAVKTNSSVADQYRKRIEELTNARNKFIENTEPWRKANERLTAFQEDKNTLAVFAQEQVAIKNLEDAKARLGQANNQEAESYQKVTASIETLNAAANMLKTTLGSIDTNKGNTAQLVENFEKLHNELSAVVAELKKIDLSKLNFSGVNLDLSKVAGIGDLNSAIRGLEVSINEIINLFSKLSNAVKLDASSEIIKKMQADADAAQKTIAELTEKMNNLAAAQKNVAETASKTGKSEQQIGDSQATLFNRYNKLLADIQNIKREIVEIQRGAGGGGLFGDKLGDYFSALNRIRNLVREITSSPSVADAITKGMSSEQLAKLNSALAALKTNFKEVIADAKDFNKATDKGSSQAEARIRKLGMAFNELKNYMKANGGSEEMKRLQQEIQGAIRKMRDLMNAGRFGEAINVYERLSGLIRQAASATKEFEKAQHSVSSAVSHANSNLQHQSQILSDLKSMAMQYLSVWGAQSFINNIIELGGQLEQQRLSIGAILQDTAQANHLFSQIKDLAIKSPFGVQQLDAMTKQLSAYGFQYSELYDWTKRLADISAATGTSVDRLALALGHVRSEGALSGYTLRQFSMGNIPLLQKLSENLGKTKQEIRKMTRNKEIGYEDVLNVLKQLTDESGMFYQAQETMAQALNAKFKNLRDSFQIMYSEMAEGVPGDFLKGVAEVLTDISKSWRVLMPIVLSGAGTLGIWKLSTMALNHELERSGKLLVGNAISTSKYSMNQLRAIATTGRFTIALKGLGRAMMSIGKFIFNPVTLGFAAVEGLIYLWSKHNDEVRKASDLTKAYGEAAVESEKNIAKQLEKIKPFSNMLDDSALKTGIDSMTESIKNYAINGQSIINGMFSKDAEGNVMSLAEKYQYLRGELEDTIKVYKELKRVKDAFEYGITESDGGWLDDNVETDITQYADAYKKFVDDVTSYNSKYGNSIENAIKNAQNCDLAFREATKNMKSYGEMLAEFWSNSDKYQNAALPMNKLFGIGAGSNDALNLNESFFGYLNKKNEAMRELDQFMENTEKRLKEKGYDFSKELAPEQVGALLKMSKDWIEKHPEWENIYDTIKEKLEGRWPIKIVPDTTPVEEELPEWMDKFQKELDKTGIVLTADMSMEQIVDLMKKAYDQAQTTINKLGPVALTAKINVVGMSDEEIEAYNNPLSPNYNPEMYQWLKQLKGAYAKRDTVDAAAKKRGIKLEGMKKDGSHKAEKQNQENAKAVREQVRVIKEAADAFQYWRDKVGDKGAWEHVQSEFGDVLAKIGITAQNIEDVRGQLQRIPQMKEYKAIKDKKVKTEIDKEIAKENDQFVRKDFERDTEKFLSSVQIQLDDLTRSWEIFNQVRESTGDIDLAVNLSGVDYQNGKNRNLADALKKKIEQDFANLGVVSIPFNFTLDDEAIQREVEKAFKESEPTQQEGESKKDYMVRLSKYQSHIKGIVTQMIKWRNLQRDVFKNDITSYAKILGSVESYENMLKKIDDEYKKQKEDLDNDLKNGNINRQQYDQAHDIIKTQRDMNEWKISTEYINLMNNSLVMTRSEIEAAANAQEEYLNRALQNGVIKMEEFMSEMMKLQEIRKEWSTEGFFGMKGGVGAFLSGGNDALMKYYQNRSRKAYQEYSNADYKDSPEAQEKLEEAKHYENLYIQLVDLSDAAKKVVTSFQMVSNGVSLLGDLFDALGMEGASNAMGDAGGILSGMLGGASSLSALGPYGMAAGAALGLATGLFQLHDKSIQREIDAIKEQVDALEQNTAAIKQARERTLGYDMGIVRRGMSTLYNNTQKDYSLAANIMNAMGLNIQSAAKNAMKEYYKTNASGTGYSQELENLKQEREQYIKLYDLENSKKKKSNESLNEYKEKIAELDYQITYFVEDLANELWGIDFKSWADQISDALWTAFENGEDALEAFRETAKDIIADVAKRMMNIHFIEPLFQQLEKELFGYVDTNGNKVEGKAYNYTTGQWNEEETLRILGKFFGAGGEMEKAAESAEMFYEFAKKVSGVDFAATDSSSSASASIKSITEQTADLLASYVNAIRADVSVNRTMIAQYFPLFYQSLTANASNLRNIENHTAAIMRSNDTIASKIESIDSNITGLKNKTWKMPIA